MPCRFNTVRPPLPTPGWDSLMSASLLWPPLLGKAIESPSLPVQNSVSEIQFSTGTQRLGFSITPQKLSSNSYRQSAAISWTGCSNNIFFIVESC